MKLLIERVDARNYIVEAEGTQEKKYYVEGICIQSNLVNRNDRYYPKEVIKPEVDRYINEMLQKNRAVGELNHPAQDPSIDYDRACIKFISLVESGDNWVGKAVVTKGTPKGALVAGLMDEGVEMGISSRAVGSTEKSKIDGKSVDIVQHDFYLIAAGDIVSDPSAPDAYLTNLMEGKEWAWLNGALVSKEKQIKETVNKLARYKQLNNRSKVNELFSKIISSI